MSRWTFVSVLVAMSVGACGGTNMGSDTSPGGDGSSVESGNDATPSLDSPIDQGGNDATRGGHFVRP